MCQGTQQGARDSGAARSPSGVSCLCRLSGIRGGFKDHGDWSKLEEIVAMLKQWEGRKAGSKKELESLVGKLSFAAWVVTPGRTFMGRLFKLLRGAEQGSPFQSDILWWLTFMEEWNGISMIGRPTARTDASGHFGCGALQPANGAWFPSLGCPQ